MEKKVHLSLVEKILVWIIIIGAISMGVLAVLFNSAMFVVFGFYMMGTGYCFVERARSRRLKASK